MIDRTQLTEALAVLMDGDDVRELDRHTVEAFPRSVAALAEAARLLLDFPTDEQVEAAARHLADGGKIIDVLLAVRDTMIGDQ